jgi:exosome complex component RRP45
LACPEKQDFVSNKFALCRFESGRITEECVEINRLLERCLKESKCLDLESLCIVSEEKVSLEQK